MAECFVGGAPGGAKWELIAVLDSLAPEPGSISIDVLKYKEVMCEFSYTQGTSWPSKMWVALGANMQNQGIYADLVTPGTASGSKVLHLIHYDLKYPATYPVAIVNVVAYGGTAIKVANTYLSGPEYLSWNAKSLYYFLPPLGNAAYAVLSTVQFKVWGLPK